ncbi:MAG TPA: hypothetical protein VMX13_13700 [Sedimentisphaerales bacterium]|nr:hypothetical protein [Sedimentisphaerales bacterium]
MREYRSEPWDTHCTENDFRAAERRYGKLAENLEQLASRVHRLIDRLHDTERNVSTIIILIKEGEDLYSEDCYVPTELVKSTLNIHYSALKLKRLIELYVGEDEARLLYYRLRRSLALMKGWHYGLDRSETKSYDWLPKNRDQAKALVKHLERLSALQTSRLGRKRLRGPSALSPKQRVKKVTWSRPLSMQKWAEMFTVSVSTIRRWINDNTKNRKYHFKNVSARKWILPTDELPGEYLLKYKPDAS